MKIIFMIIKFIVFYITKMKTQRCENKTLVGYKKSGFPKKKSALILKVF